MFKLIFKALWLLRVQLTEQFHCIAFPRFPFSVYFWWQECYRNNCIINPLKLKDVAVILATSAMLSQTFSFQVFLMYLSL